MNSRINIGVMGCARIAKRSVLPAIKKLNDRFHLVGVASRSRSKAESFAKEFSCEAFVGYESLLSRSDIDAIYIPLPTGLHHQWIMAAVTHGIHVYAEKSFVSNHCEASEIIDEAKKENIALMEGYMFQYHHQHSIVKNLLRERQIGDIRSFSSSFGFPPLEKSNFRYDKNLGGGVLMDAAGYTVRSALMLLGSELKVAGSSLHIDPESGVDLYGCAFLKNKFGVGAQLSYGFDNYYQCNYKIWGSSGMIHVPKAFTPKNDEETIIVIEKNNEQEIIKCDAEDHFVSSFTEFANLIEDGESKDKHYNEILKQATTLERIRDVAE